MNVTVSLRLSVFCLAALVFSIVALSAEAQNFDEVEIRVEQVAEGIYLLVGSGGNLGLSVGEDGAFLIDDQYAPLTDKIKAAIATVTDQPIRFVLNTHWHGDHTGGNENMGAAGALIVAHDNVRERMSTEQFNSLFDTTTPPSPEGALPVVTFTDAVTFHLNGEEIYAMHTPPAHTDGDAFVYFKEANVIHMGDLYFNGGYPFIDLDSGGSAPGLLEALDLALGMIDDDTRVIPGHGALSDVQGLRAFREMLGVILDRVQEHVEAGRSLADIQAAKVTAAYDEAWGGAFINPEQIVQFFYISLTGKRE